MAETQAVAVVLVVEIVDVVATAVVVYFDLISAVDSIDFGFVQVDYYNISHNSDSKHNPDNRYWDSVDIVVDIFVVQKLLLEH